MSNFVSENYSIFQVKNIPLFLVFLNSARVRSVAREAAHGGEECPELVDVQSCSEDPCTGGQIISMCVSMCAQPGGW